MKWNEKLIDWYFYYYRVFQKGIYMFEHTLKIIYLLGNLNINNGR
jgi:hypothetical protein